MAQGSNDLSSLPLINYCIAGNFRQRKFRQKRPSGSSSGIYFRQKPVVARFLFARSVVALLLIVYFHIHEYF